MGDFAYYRDHQRGPEALSIFGDLYATVVRETSGHARDDAVRLWLAYLEKVVSESGESTDRNMLAIRRSIDALAALLDGDRERAATASTGLKRLAQALVGHTDGVDLEVLERALGLLSTALARAYEGWLACDDPADWYRELSASELTERLPEPVERISHVRLRAVARELDRCRSHAGPLRDRLDVLLALPDNRQIERAYLGPAELLGSSGAAEQATRARVGWLFRVLGEPRLVSVHETALRDVSRSCAAALGETGAGEDLLRKLFGELRASELRYPDTVLGLVGRIGRAALETGTPALADTLVDELLTLEFHYPAFAGFTEEWSVRIDPAHVENVRTYLGMIEAHPLLSRPILAALVVHLKVGGLFAADSDLLQRDVASLLRANIRPVYVQLKHLLKLLPVYFSEIGAEGELRETSTRLDEASQRRDVLCHFLRKQCHVECNPQLVPFVEDIARYWASGDRSPLRRYLPETIFESLGNESRPRLGEIFRELGAAADGIEHLLTIDTAEARARLALLEGYDAADLEKAELLLRVGHEIRRKYALDYHDVPARLRAAGLVDARLVDALEQAVSAKAHEPALELALSILEQLQALVLSDERTEWVEDIYFKRHIAPGIPSMYGSFRDRRLEAMGLVFRLEAMATALFDEVIREDELVPLDARALRQVSSWLHLLLRALRTDGFRAQGVAHCLSMLDETLDAGRASSQQYLNIFQLMSRSIESLVRARILDVYERSASRIVAGMIERGRLPGTRAGGDDGPAFARVETILRDLIAGSFGLQRLDLLLGNVLQALNATDGRSIEAPGRRGSSPSIEECIVPLGAGSPLTEGVVRLGNKGFMLARLTDLRFPVPEGFILTTELFDPDEAIWRSSSRRGELSALLRAQLGPLEQRAGGRLGDSARPLLLSVRGGAPVSMPGMLDSFLNVGVNAAIAEGMAAAPGRAWAAWDAYRRFLQFWGMSHDLSRGLFDALIADAKRRHSVAKKALLPPDRMRELAFDYRDLLLDHGVAITEDPFEQVVASVQLVQRSWSSAKASAFRRELGIAEEWGTAVIVQRMVFGNLGPRSGTGVVLTRHPARGSDAVELYGDFVVQGQGDDVVSGLVQTFPISETQRCERPEEESSLERDFPGVYGALLDVARSLVEEHGMNHQELEFTFEGDAPADLYLLQTRDTVAAPTSVVEVFEPGAALERSRAATGIGVSGGALSGRVACTAEQVATLKGRFPGEPIILLRRDTVPDDIALVLEADGILTAIGGATSHAAVAAKRLGKTCVVGCRALDVDERHGRARIGSRTLSAGDLLSISGVDGAVYNGTHAVTNARVPGRAQR